MGALLVGDVRAGTIPSLLPSQKHYLKVYSLLGRILRCLRGHILQYARPLSSLEYSPKSGAIL
ncbi:MAG: hypothetical protein V1736_03820 [Pseudomonadota bacterium]